MSVRLLLVYPYKSERLQLVLWTFTKIRRKTPNFLKTGQKYRAFYMRARYVLTVGSCTKYFAARQQRKQSHLLHFHGATERVCIVDSCVYFNNNEKERQCCVSMATTLHKRATLLRHTYIVYFVSLSRRPS